ncbi:hypothetical protein W03_09870 [Nitrosomonas sp. PY1]|uniref:DUF1064 domain-containing protein n=1 Tax=Nitrosomonas sp. PY1 TaxID=1803906 RepID=UPI001FC7DEDB|nr:DUF1064 domain-containing protein [Nitrosomonas sp. PY1]GKS68983.1 hypothetical protein W03_09870 [Nitrosomonas sp. PY1]
MSNKRLYALGRLKKGQLNKTEQSYQDHLELLMRAGEILWYKFEGMTFRLADNLRYTPDFICMNKNGELEAVEVKSWWVGDAKAKIKMASQLFPIKFTAVYAKPKKDGGGWRMEEF